MVSNPRKMALVAKMIQFDSSEGKKQEKTLDGIFKFFVGVFLVTCFGETTSHLDEITLRAPCKWCRAIPAAPY